MVNPQFIEEQQVSLAEAKELLLEIEKKNAPLNYLSNKTKEYLEQFAKEISTPIYALDDQSAVKVDGDTLEVISEGKWKKFN